MIQEKYSEEDVQNEKRIMKQRDKIAVGILLAVLGVLLFSAFCNHSQTEQGAEQELLVEDTESIEKAH